MSPFGYDATASMVVASSLHHARRLDRSSFCLSVNESQERAGLPEPTRAQAVPPGLGSRLVRVVQERLPECTACPRTASLAASTAP